MALSMFMPELVPYTLMVAIVMSGIVFDTRLRAWPWLCTEMMRTFSDDMFELVAKACIISNRRASNSCLVIVSTILLVITVK
jgi:hypothetical protein